MRHFVRGTELDPYELLAIVDRASEFKARPFDSCHLERRTVALLFERPSTRTRASLQAGIVELGGQTLVVDTGMLQLSHGESLRDTAVALSSHVCAIGLRTLDHERLQELARWAEVPVINLLSPLCHPLQTLADCLTLREEFGWLQGLRVAFVGDGNDVARSLAEIGTLLGIEVVIASPSAHQLPDVAVVQVEDPQEAVRGAHAIYTDVWTSAGSSGDRTERELALGAFRLDDSLLDVARSDVIALHCLPAHPGREITADVLYGPRQRIWRQAENRRHTGKALLEHLVERGETSGGRSVPASAAIAVAAGSNKGRD